MTLSHYLVPRSACAWYIKDLYSKKKNLLIICRDYDEIERIKSQLQSLVIKPNIVVFEPWDTTPYDKTSPYLPLQAQRIESLYNMVNSKESIVITTHNALMQKVLSYDTIKQHIIHITQGDNIDRDGLVKNLISIGYNRTSVAIDIGDIAVRGSVIDIVTISGAYRIDFFGDNIDAIKLYDVHTQSTIEKLSNINILPASEVILNEKTVSKFKTKYRQLFGHMNSKTENILYEAVGLGSKYQGMEQYLPLFYDENDCDSIFNYIGKYTILSYLEDEADPTLAYKDLEEHYNMRLSFLKKDEQPLYPMPIEELYLTDIEYNNKIKSLSHHYLTIYKHKDTQETNLHINTSSAHSILEDYSKYKIVAACHSIGSMEKVKDILEAKGYKTNICNRWVDILDHKNSISLFQIDIESGFKYNDIIILSEEEIIGHRVVNRSKKNKAAKTPETIFKELSNIEEGELVVHRNYGIGKFVGLEIVSVNNISHDCLKILYHGGDKLYLPVENMDIISKYGSDDKVDLDKLGGTAWQARTAKLKNRIKLQAEAIIKIAAERSLSKVASLDVYTPEFEEFCDKFPYAETDDQINAVNDIIDDISNGRLMDRLICGDVGFGKTEVAMRAAFIVANSGMQVAVIVPTTLLANQHYKNFVERFSGMPMIIKQISRLVKPSEIAKTKAELENGHVNIVIGTHAILSNTTKFKNLGMVIIDEEQHFGVAQKDKLKDMKSNVRVLTLTATPIPRTLHMAMSGIRDLSIIATPPINRHAVKTYVAKFDPVAIREAIMNEKSRGGKVLYVCPRVSDIIDVEDNIKSIVPEAKYVIAHGQMPATALEKAMNDFYEGHYDLLISTTIVESGLDVPSANTMIIHRADMFGLSQLYQLRGRVGRGKIRAFAYLIMPNNKMLTPQAIRRLEVMQQLDTLGSGFMVANYDMDIRGMGNLLGDEQSGHIKEVGVELYQDMLAEEISKLKDNTSIEEITTEAQSPQINIGLSVLIPEEYIPDMQIRMGIYRRISMIKNQQELDSFYAEMIDRFGAMPETAKNLFTIIGIKQKCLDYNISKIDSGPKGIVISFYNDTPKDLDKLISMVAKNPGLYKFRADNKFVIIYEIDGVGIVIELLEKLFQFS